MQKGLEEVIGLAKGFYVDGSKLFVSMHDFGKFLLTLQWRDVDREFAKQRRTDIRLSDSRLTSGLK